MGGRSSEHEVSLDSARSVIEGLDPDRYDVVPIEIPREGPWLLDAEGGRAGSTWSFRSCTARSARTAPCRASSSSPGSPTSAPASPPRRSRMDKDLFKSVMRDKGIPVARSLTVRTGEEAASPFGFPCVVKPARLGSSVGISVVRDEEDLPAAVELAFAHDEKILVEEFLDGRRGRVQRARERRSRRLASRARSSRSRATGTTTRPSTPRAAWSSSSRRASRPSPQRASRSWRSRRSSPPTARAWPGSTSSSGRTARSSSTS